MFLPAEDRGAVGRVVTPDALEDTRAVVKPVCEDVDLCVVEVDELAVARESRPSPYVVPTTRTGSATAVYPLTSAIAWPSVTFGESEDRNTRSVTVT